MLSDNLIGIREGKVFVSNSKDVRTETTRKIVFDLEVTLKGAVWDLEDLEETISII